MTLASKSISFIIPTIGRESLQKTLDSIHELPEDEVIVIEDNPPSKKWGNPQRNQGMEKATCDYLAFIDDDDWYVDGAREILSKALAENTDDFPMLFRMQYPNGDVIWNEPKLVPGNVSTQMIVVPNNKEMLYYWEGGRNMADFIFISKCKWSKESIIWREEILVKLGHDDLNKL